jgi:hypothetical protein
MFIGEKVVLTGPIILLNIILPNTTRKCDRKYYTKSILLATQTIIMSHWMMKKPKQQHRRTLHFPRLSISRCLTPNALLYKIVRIRVRVY